MSDVERDGKIEQGSSLYAALAHTATRTAALYFSRPVRLFRPSKVSGWIFLQSLASQNGVSLTPQFMHQLIKQHGFLVLPRHFIPPIAINAMLGTVLWTSYSWTSSFLEQHVGHPLAISMMSGAVAGGAQALLAAPAENLRLVLEGGRSQHGWSSAWRDVFVGTGAHSLPKDRKLREARQIRRWVKEISEMTGRGWNGWGWGFAKDVLGFSVFFSLFDLTRRAAIRLRSFSANYMNTLEEGDVGMSRIPRAVHGATLVSGGVLAGLAYEVVGRPFDIARRAMHIQQLSHPSNVTPVASLRTFVHMVKDDGMSMFFRDPFVSTSGTSATRTVHQRIYAALRILGRAGPWGVGFLIYESFGPGLGP